MTQYPYGPSSAPGGPWAARSVPPRTPDLRLLLRLTVASLAIGVLGSVIGYLTSSEQVAAASGGMFLGTGFVLASAVVGVAVNAGLYALVFFPLRDQRQWAWILGIVFASMAVLSTVASLVLSFAVPVVPTGTQPLQLLPAALKLAVDVAWLVVAVRPGVRAALR